MANKQKKKIIIEIKFYSKKRGRSMGRVKRWRKYGKKIEMSLIVRTMCVRWNEVYSDEVLLLLFLMVGIWMAFNCSV